MASDDRLSVLGIPRLIVGAVSRLTEEREPGQGPPVPIEAVPALARLAAGAWYRGATWGIGTSLRASRRIAEAALSPDSAAELIDEVRAETVDGLRRILGDEPELAGDRNGGSPAARSRDAESERERVRSLRERGEALLERASEVAHDDERLHPGFDRIIDQLAPDEARILKLLVNEGPQPIVYVNRAAPLGLAPREVARRLTLIGREAGCQRPELVAAYLDNLVRLGLVAIRRDPVTDEQRYQVLEAQPEVTEAIQSARSGIFFGQTSRRSIHVTDFGRTFCQVCFPAEHLTGEFEAIDLDGTEDLPPPEPDLDAEPADH